MTARKAQGTTVHISTQDADATAYGSATFVQIGELKGVPPAGGEAADIDVTNLSSTAKEYLTGLQDNGTFEMPMNWDPDDVGQLELRDALDNQERRWIKITWSTGDGQYAKGLVKKYNPGAEVDGAIQASSSIRVSGSWTYF